MKTSKSRIFILIFCLNLLLLACSLGGKAPDPTLEPLLPTEVAQVIEDTPVPAVSAVVLGAEQRCEEGGFLFKAIPGYEIQDMGRMVSLLKPGADPEIGPVFTLVGGEFTPMTPEELFEQVKAGLAVELDDPAPILVDGNPGLLANISGETHGVRMGGRVALTMVHGSQQFILVAAAPEAEWSQVEPYFMELISSIEFIEIQTNAQSEQAGTVSVLDPGLYLYTNANVVRDLAVSQNFAYAATLGGAVGWNLERGFGNKQTTIQGMGHISANAVVVCNIPEQRVIYGTLEGLSIFDPFEVKWERRLLLPEESGMQGRKITKLFCDEANQRLLIAFGGAGLGVLDLGTGAFERYTTAEGLSWNDVADLAVTGQDIWLATGYNGINVIGGGEVLTFNQASAGLPDEKVLSLAVAPDGTIWAGARSGLMKFDRIQWVMVGSESPAGLSDVAEIEIASDGKIWVATAPLGAGRLCQFDPASQGCLVELVSPDNLPITALALDSQGYPVFGTSQGVYHYDGQNITVFAVEDDRLVSNFVDSIASDPSGKLWVGADAGIQQIDPVYTNSSPWITYQAKENPGMGGNWANGMAAAQDGTLWVSITNGAASRFKDGEWTSFEAIYSFDCVTVDAQGRAWFGDSSKGIVVLNPDGSQAFTLTEVDGLPGSRAQALYALGDVVWIGTDQGVYSYQDGTLEKKFGKEELNLPAAYIVDFASDPSGALLIGANLGVARYDGAALETIFNFQEVGISAWLTGLAAAPGARIWVGTQNGLYYSDDHMSWARLGTADKMPTHFISALHVDANGNLWVGGGGSNFDGGGLLRIVP